MANILLVEDDPNVRKLIQVNLEREGNRVTSCDSGKTALEMFENNEFNLIILDWMIKGDLTGLDVCKALNGKVPILMVTARSTPTDIILGLEMGADDYLTKPFEIGVLIARVRSLLRRTKAPTESKGVPVGEITVGSLKVHAERVEVFCDGNEIKLTASEFKILVAMLSRQGTVLSRDQLIKMVQTAGLNVTERVIDTHIYSLRNKLGACSQVIETIRGIGYRIKS